MPDGGAVSIASIRPSLPSYSRSRTSGQFLLFTMSNAGLSPAEIRKQSSDAGKRFPTSSSGFWLLISEILVCDKSTSHGGARRDRTDDLLLAKQALSQLSYGPVRDQRSGIGANPEMVGLGGFELPTSPLSGVRSNQLIYRPLAGMGPKLKPRRTPIGRRTRLSKKEKRRRRDLAFSLSDRA